MPTDPVAVDGSIRHAPVPTLADPPPRARGAGGRQPRLPDPGPAPVLDEREAALLAALGVPVAPARALDGRGRVRPGFVLARIGGEGGPARAYMTGPLGLDHLAAAARSPDPVALLARLVPGGEDAVYGLAAAARGLPMRRDLAALKPLPPAGRMPPPRVAAALAAFRFAAPDGSVVTVVAPRSADLLPALARLAAAPPGSVAVTTPRRLFGRLARALGGRTMAEAAAALGRLDPQLSAARRPSWRERAAIVGAVVAMPLALLVWPAAVWVLLHGLSAASFLALGAMRLAAAARTPVPPPPPTVPDAELPLYTVLVALYREAHMLPGLVGALERLDYPTARLEIRLLLEADDAETIAAARRAVAARPHMDVLVCPPGTPRTKPRALAYGLAFARGALVTVFDAEDRPHPGQLRAAAAAFAAGPADLACVQARLTVDRVRTGLQRQFAVEYAILFRGLLPWLAARGLPLPLGGTSNHFRREALDDVLGWDPFNVTEDADLGFRLMRYGWRVDVLDSDTLEEAPAGVRVWLAQRRRWIKGWMVTFLVHARHPLTLVREIGWRNAAMVPMHVLANVAAPLCHPIGLALFGLHAAGALPLPVGTGFGATLLFAASALGILFGYGGSILVARRMLLREGRADLARAVAAMPLYWLLASLAAWRALAELVTAPHRWAKTPHDRHDGTDGEEEERGEREGGLERVKGIEPSS